MNSDNFCISAHVRAGSTGSMKSFMAASTGSSINPKEELRCILEQQQQGHQQPLTCMDVVGGTVFTGSQDHTLKVCNTLLGLITLSNSHFVRGMPFLLTFLDLYFLINYLNNYNIFHMS